MKFSEVKGSPLIKTILINAAVSGKIANAYMFVGQSGVGRFTTAKMFAQLANCNQREGNDLCGVCPSCLKIELGNHPDYFTIFPKDGMIKIDQIRQLQRSFSYATYEGKHRFAIIDDAHLMTEEAANCLLKTLEEPPPKSSIVLICPSVQSMLPTLVSRSQVYNFNSIPTTEILDYIKSTFSVDDKTASFIAYLSAGSIGKCHHFVNDAELMKRREFNIKLFFRMFSELPFGLMNTISDLSAENQKELLETWLLLVFDIIKARTSDNLLNSDFKEELDKFASVPLPTLQAFVCLLKDNIYALNKNANIKIIIEYIASYCTAIKTVYL